MVIIESIISGPKQGHSSCFALRTNAIHNPTLEFLHCWVAMTLNPKIDVRTIELMS